MAGRRALPLGRARHDPLDRLRRPLLGERRHLLEHALQVARRLEAGGEAVARERTLPVDVPLAEEVEDAHGVRDEQGAQGASVSVHGADVGRAAGPRQVRVSLAKRVTPELLDLLAAGLRDDGEWLKAKRAKLLKATNTRSEVELVLAEGKNREIRLMFRALNHRVLRLQRIAVGPVKLGELPLGKWRMLSRAEIDSCLRFASKSQEVHRRN